MNDNQTDLLTIYSIACSYFGFIALMNLITLELIRGWFEIETEGNTDE